MKSGRKESDGELCASPTRGTHESDIEAGDKEEMNCRVQISIIERNINFDTFSFHPCCLMIYLRPRGYMLVSMGFSSAMNVRRSPDGLCIHRELR
jgi:hypothetical protein